jgi:polysaccharide biosynthesis transport protein
MRARLGLPCFALIPELSRHVLRRFPVEEYAAQRPLSPFAEQLRGLRAALWLGPASPRVVAITAARPSEGKTTIAIGLGRSAALSGERVIVLDCDVRQPSFGRLMRADGELGIADCLLGHASLEEVIRKDPLTGMAFIVAGSAEANSLALFMSDTLGKLLDRLRADYDLILLDAPPAFAMADARVIARTADATLLCVRWRDTPRSIVRNSLEILEEMRAKVVGVALTRVDARAHVRSGFADAEVYHSRFGGYFRN